MTADASADAIKDEVKITKSSDDGVKYENDKNLQTIEEFKNEAISHRLKAKAVKADFDSFKNETEQKYKEFETEKLALTSKVEKLTVYEKKLIDAEIKAELVIAGIKDTDLAKLIDASDLKVSDDGSIDLDAIKSKVEALKESKPFLFGEEKKFSTSVAGKIEKKTEKKRFNVLDMNDAEYEKERKAFLRLKNYNLAN